MATFFPGESHTFSEYLLVPGYSSSQCIPNNVSLKTPLTRFKRGEKPAITLNIPMVSAIMQSVSGVDMGVALATEGGLSFIYGSQSAESEAAMVKAVKDHKAGFVQSDSTLTPDMTMEQVIELKEKTGHSTMPVTDDGTPKGKLLGIVTSRDYRPSRDDHQTKVSEFMTPREQLIVGDKNISLKVANDVIWDNKLNALPIVDDNDHLMGIVFRKDYDSHKTNPNELLDNDKRYMVGAGINTRDYAERVPLLIEAGADVLCIDSSEGFSEWQKRTIEWIRANYGEDVKVGAGNVVDAEGFRFFVETTSAHWHRIVAANKTAPANERRYFYADILSDNYNLDCIVMEVSKEQHAAWSSERRSARRNRDAAKAYTVLSLEELVENHSAALPSVECQEDALINSVVIGELKKALAAWNIWGTEVLEMYLSGKSCMVAKFLMDNYGFSRRTAFRKKNEFENFSKNFLSEWHY